MSSTLPDLYATALSTALEIERLTNQQEEPRLSSLILLQRIQAGEKLNLEYRSPYTRYEWLRVNAPSVIGAGDFLRLAPELPEVINALLSQRDSLQKRVTELEDALTEIQVHSSPCS